MFSLFRYLWTVITKTVVKARMTCSSFVQKLDTVFKTPMTFSPRLFGDVARPSPSRNEMLKAQLGFDGNAPALALGAQLL